MQPETNEPAPKSLPIWLSIPIILLSLGAGFYIVHWYVMTDPISHESKILGDVPAQAIWGGPPRNRQGAPGGNPAGAGARVRPPAPMQRRTVTFDQNNGDLEVRTDKARASATVQNGKPNIHFMFYLNTAFLPDEAHKTILAANALHKNQAMMDSMKLAPAQQNKLRVLSANLPMVTTPADKQAFADAAVAYTANTSDRTANEAKLLQLLDDISDRSMEATKKEAVDRAAQINQIVTPDLWKLNAAGGK